MLLRRREEEQQDRRYLRNQLVESPVAVMPTAVIEAQLVRTMPVLVSLHLGDLFLGQWTWCWGCATAACINNVSRLVHKGAQILAG